MIVLSIFFDFIEKGRFLNRHSEWTSQKILYIGLILNGIAFVLLINFGLVNLMKDLMSSSKKSNNVVISSRIFWRNLFTFFRVSRYCLFLNKKRKDIFCSSFNTCSTVPMPPELNYCQFALHNVDFSGSLLEYLVHSF